MNASWTDAAIVSKNLLVTTNNDEIKQHRVLKR